MINSSLNLVQQLQEDKRLTQQHQLDIEEILQQVMRQSEHLQQQITHGHKAANRRTREMEEENHGLHQRVSSFMSDVLSWSISLTHQQVRQLEEEMAHLQQGADQAQQMIRKMAEESQGLQQQVSLHNYNDESTYPYINRSDMYKKGKHTWRKSYTSRSAPYWSDLYLANTLSHTSTGQTAGGGEGTLTADGRTRAPEDHRVGGGESPSSPAGLFFYIIYLTFIVTKLSCRSDSWRTRRQICNI